jgi:DNA-binding NtrC family response regulator
MDTKSHPSTVDAQASALLAINLVGRSDALLRVFDIVKRIADYDVTVSIFGETGTGKELVARSLHYLSSRAAGPFVPVNCGSLPDTMVESELFGHKRGAFTDASSDRAGLIEQANGGTLFLDEIEALSSKAQVSLLRFLQDLQFRRVGGSTLQTADVRIVVASNIELHQMQGEQFRNDLFYRLDVLPIRLPPLRERSEDIPLLAEHFLEKFKIRYALEDKFLSSAALQWFASRDWPGNVRELQNSIHRGLLLAEGNEICPRHLQAEAGELPTETATSSNMHFKDAKVQAIEDFERNYLSSMLSNCSGNITLTAERAHIDRSTMGRLLKKHQLNYRDFLLR